MLAIADERRGDSHKLHPYCKQVMQRARPLGLGMVSLFGRSPAVKLPVYELNPGNDVKEYIS